MSASAIVTGASRGIGLAIAETLADLGHSLTVTARRPEPLEEVASKLRERGVRVEPIAENLADPEAPGRIAAVHRDAFGSLDVLVNNAGVGFGAAAGEQQTKYVDLQWNINTRAMVLLYRETVEMLRAAAAEHGTATVINMSSIAGRMSPAWLSVYGATKAAVISYTKSMNAELAGDRIKSVALCPGFVDTDMAEFIKEDLGGTENMIRTEDIAAAVRFVLQLSPACTVPEIVMERVGDSALGA